MNHPTPRGRALRLALTLSAGLGLMPAGRALADEPNRPTASPSEKNPAVPAAGHSVHGEAFDDGPRQKAYLMPGMGQVDFPVTVSEKLDAKKKADALAFVTQGVAQLHTFYYFESERSFRQAALSDPDCPMGYWGMAMSNVNNARRAKGFLKEANAKAAKTKITRREQLYLDALNARYKTEGDDKSRRQGEILGLETLVQEFPGDLNARAWLAMVTWQAASQDGIGSRQAVDTIIDTILEKASLHPGGHHYRIHLWDGVKPARAEKSAGLYAKAAPGIAHAWHMPGHTYTGLQRYADASYQQEGSARVDHAYMMRDRVMPFEIHNYFHNNQWLCTSLSHIGRARDAIVVARNLVEQPRDPQKNGPNDGGSAQRVGRLRWSEVLTRFELWDDLIAATTSGALDWTDIPAEKKEKAYTLGLAYAARGDAAKLAEQVAILKGMAPASTATSTTSTSTSGRPSTPGSTSTTTPSAPRPRPAMGGANAAPALAELEGYQLLAKGDDLGAIDKFKQATGMRPEALARAYLSRKNFGLAESTAKDAVAKNPNQAPPLVALVEALSASGKAKEAQEAYAKLEPLMKSADRDLPMFRRLAAIADGWKSRDGWKPAGDTPTDETTAGRVDLTTLGPLGWAPLPAEPLKLTDTAGKPFDLADHKGKNVVVLFFLGNKCAHCLQQLQDFGKEMAALKALNTDLVAVSTDDMEKAKEIKDNKEGVKFPMRILPNPGLEAFKSYRAHDDFEGVPMHGIFLIDAQGRVRWRRISAEPFLDVDFIKKETARVSKVKM